ncbi:CD59 glycoprotein-like [Seriola dumerili]|uniref:MAC-inhibitory protein n=1 Tax=Seriola dumerili TaxID=41447 RepID=A0A3B4T203_SERDU|nr:CD59 glycoprotein-like [Seriola dumerili]
MKRCLGLLLLLLWCGMLQPGAALRCYNCIDYTGRCGNIQDCTNEDSCLTLSEKVSTGGKTIRRCIRYTDCNFSRLSQMYQSISSFTYNCCSNNLCNSSNAVTTTTPILALLGSLLTVWWSWM